MRRRVLYIDHSGARGGALLALCSVIRRLDRARYEPIVACIQNVPEVLSSFGAAGAETLHAPGIRAFPHTTGGWDALHSPIGAVRAARAAAAFVPSARATAALVRRVGADLVHLNSLVLAPSAAGARAAGVPVVWQVRESVHPGHARVRQRLLGRALARWSDAAVFVSADDRLRLVRGRLGLVIPDPVDHSRFDRTLDGMHVRVELGVAPDAPLVLFMGGVSAIKGAHVLLAALPRARRRLPGLRVVVAGAPMTASRALVARTARAVLPLVGRYTERQRFERAYRGGEMDRWVCLLPFRPDPERLMAAADLVVFPSTVPHSALPVIEAGAMAKPVVASRLGGVEELVEDGVTGILVPPADPGALADAMVRVLDDPVLAARMGEAGYARTLERHAIGRHVGRLLSVYDEVLAGR
ncbi:MAG: glycosyltransferase family 4 protein [Gemmatimonadetes bacterium]|nr:glycosyltransferase family 4 protein [Gemmatimonadota bacterium]